MARQTVSLTFGDTAATPEERLLLAVIIQAANDLRDKTCALQERRSARRFFLGGWFQVMGRDLRLSRATQARLVGMAQSAILPSSLSEVM